MKNLIYFFVIVLFFSCSENNSTDTNISKNNTPTKVEVAHASPISVVQRDTNPAPKRNPNYVIDTSRPKDKINSTYPFDISMTTAEREVVNSEDILKKNGKPTVVLFWLTT